MPRLTWSFTAPLALSVALLAGACKDGSNDSTVAQDSTLARDLQLANHDTAAQPQLRDVPAPAPRAGGTTRTTPRRPTSTRPTRPRTPVVTPSGNTVEPTQNGSERPVVTVGAGTLINLTSSDRVCTNSHNVGDRFTATVSEPVPGGNGTIIPAGAKAVIQMTAENRSDHAGEPVRMAFSVLSISWNGKTYPLSSEITHVDVEKVRSSTTKSDAKKVIGGAAVGAVLGQVIGRDAKSTVIGAAAGAAAGTAAAIATANYEGCVPTGGKIQIRLTTPATVQAD